MKIVTLNPAHETHFLLHRVKKQISDSSYNIELLYCMILNEVIKDLRNKDETILLHYAIGWRDRTKNALKFTTITSYFSGRTFKEIIDKFFFEKCESDVIIDSITLIPES